MITKTLESFLELVESTTISEVNVTETLSGKNNPWLVEGFSLKKLLQELGKDLWLPGNTQAQDIK